MRKTKQKDAILTAVQELNSHPTTETVYAFVRKQHEKISMGTVYRNLGTFAQGGALRRITLPESGDRYDARLDAHEHLYCESCGTVTDAEMVLDVNDMMRGKTPLKLTGYRLMLYGLCADCAVSGH